MKNFVKLHVTEEQIFTTVQSKHMQLAETRKWFFDQSIPYQ